jgi:predicted transposase/invertase (TIGR01784 family)
MHFRDDETGKLYNDKMELQILELKKLSGEIQTGEDIVNWMRFFNGKKRKEFEDMARVDEYLDEAYEALKRLSADDEKRLEYEARAKVLRDHINVLEGIKEEGMEEGRKEGIQMAVQAVGLHVQGLTDEEIARQCNTSGEDVRGILALYNK